MAIRIGTTGDDSLTGTANADTITGDAGNDRLIGKDGNDFIDGGSGDDSIYGGNGDDLIIDGSGFDFVFGGAGIDTMQRDWSFLDADAFVLDLNFITGRQSAIGEPPLSGDQFTGIENYTLIGKISGLFTGNSVANTIRSDMGNDTLIGNGGNDSLFAGSGADGLSGGVGDDALYGGAGKDKLTGGKGNDAFYFTARTDGVDGITDFSSHGVGNDDALYFASSQFGGLAAGQLAADRFVVRADHAAQDANDRFLFDTSDHSLWFDTNGSAAGGLTKIAILQASATLSAEDILLY